MCVVASYVIMHVIVYFGVCKCHGCIVATYVSGCLIWLCNQVLKSVCVCVCIHPSYYVSRNSYVTILELMNSSG